MTTVTFRPMPAPNNTNFERLFIARIPKGSEGKVQLALDAALTKRHTDDRQRHGDDEQRDAELLEKLTEIVDRHLSDDAAAEAMEALNGCLGGRKYGDDSPRRHDEEPNDEERERLREYLRDKDVDDGIIHELVESMPHSGMHGPGGRVHETDDRRRTSRDRRMAQDAAAERTFNEMFGADRIKQAL
jgi:hypothetical protein